ncbi:hypothetical protein Cgig2_013635 [Carnegiea gigantea]|uniref:Alpha-carbonic anhydrase domain-containing protein n=1 Tax=Carnegiea gigantea TaxID=171969 RepID=A0A9Q1QGA4_9CARY|nr:hypothetical protein Cgig2_013635 [Carnegiea gigantea]
MKNLHSVMRKGQQTGQSIGGRSTHIGEFENGKFQSPIDLSFLKIGVMTLLQAPVLPPFLEKFSLELHMVHSTSDGKTAVIGIMYKYGRPDTFLNTLLPQIKSTEENAKERDLGIVNPGNIKFGSRKYFRYIGSLTVPPCSEGVIWTIVNKVRTVSREQVGALREAVHDGFEENARPIQKQGVEKLRCTHQDQIEFEALF